MKKTTWPGNWKVVCDVCGFWYPSGEVLKRWDGLIVCKKDWEPRHPADFFKVKSEKAVPAFVRKDPPDQYTEVCDVVSSSAYVSMGAAGCLKAGNVQFTYDFLLGLTTNGH